MNAEILCEFSPLYLLNNYAIPVFKTESKENNSVVSIKLTFLKTIVMYGIYFKYSLSEQCEGEMKYLTDVKNHLL